ncbi:S8 family serine peptidase [Chryseobacterium formosus]|uniref:S8 family serine peptidase n=1 Tax=Chryseobacterium formosus TaxID=1537363 RepID=A0ABT3XUG7_9FLAO|nr:S8 family serine peptidase [Chryseobacterium formosus]MCX8525295.1 S8 family serine peptidase [Chryseobacterium formosus]
MKKTYFLILLIPSFYFSQTAEERKEIAAKSDQIANAILLSEIKQVENGRRSRITDYLMQNPNSKRILKDDDLGKEEIRDILLDGTPVLIKTYNEGAALTARANSLYSGGALGINIQGQGMVAGVWDGGPVRDSHQEFMVDGFTKVSVMDFTSSMSNHGTHVAGTIAAKGVLPAARGLAFNASILSYDWNDDLSEMLGQASTGLLVSNHSYGPNLTNNSQLWMLGAYGSDARLLDGLCFNNPYYLPVFAAGNSRNDTAAPWSTQISSKFGYDLIAGDGIAKNIVTVAAVNQVTEYTGADSVVMSSFSSWGPSDDGRIKPDISMKGVNVRSTLSSSDTATGFMSGTSMASPGVTGVLTLLQQYHNTLYNNFMRAATTKGLILHTADEAGGAAGPDYEFGWGLINADAAARVIRDKNLLTNRSIIQELNLNNSATYTKTITANGSRPLKVSISWTDPAYPTNNTGTVDPATKYLVNDLDIKVTSASGTVYYPWKLQGMSNAFAAATNTGTNDVDNFERIDIPNPSGTYTITVTHKGSLTGGNQNFTLIASSQNLVTLGTKDDVSLENQIQIVPNPVKDILNIKNNNLVEAQVVILDLSGRVIMKNVVTNGMLNVQSLVPGNYMMLYNDKKNRQVSLKFIKE